MRLSFPSGHEAKGFLMATVMVYCSLGNAELALYTRGLVKYKTAPTIQRVSGMISSMDRQFLVTFYDVRFHVSRKLLCECN